jgi:hypothetical protein
VYKLAFQALFESEQEVTVVCPEILRPKLSTYTEPSVPRPHKMPVQISYD